MKRYAGIWIDQEKAFIVLFHGEEASVHLIQSNVEGRIRLSGGSRSRTPYGPQDVASEGKIERRRKHHLQDYYQEVVQALVDADKLMIFGPGEAKAELAKEIKNSKELAAKIVSIERADKMTQEQIIAKVKERSAGIHY
jgi:stalled ribosome rescue protein Dom34